MPAAGDSYALYPDRIYADSLSLVCPSVLYLAQNREHPFCPVICRQRAFHDGRMPVPHAPPDHVCKLPAFSAPGIPVHKETEDRPASPVSLSDLPEQFLFRDLSVCCGRLVLVSTGRNPFLALFLLEEIYSIRRGCRRTVRSASPSHGSRPAGTRPRRRRIFTA